GYDVVCAVGPVFGLAPEAAQVVPCDVGVPPGDLGLFSEVPTVSPDGVLHFTPAGNGHGSTTVLVRPVDDGGTPNGGSDTGLDETLALTINPLNDAPVFTGGNDAVVLENSGPQTIPGWATDIGPGPNETGQSVAFTATVVGPGLTFATAPVVAPNGDLTFETAFLATGTATIDVYAIDDGATGGGHVNQSAAQTFTITATPAANQSPVAGDFAVGALEDGSFVDIDVSTFVSDPDDLVASLTASLQITETDRGASVAVIGPRTIRYTPAPDIFGADPFAYTIADPDQAVDSGTITVNLAPTPDAPNADDDGYQVFKNTQLTIPASLGVLGNDIDVDPGPLSATVVSPPPVGALSLAGDGSFTYDPPPGFTGPTSFSYRATGANGSSVATVDLLVDSGVGTPVVYLGQTGVDSEHYDFLFSMTAPANPEPDVDVDGFDGLTLVDAGVPGTGGDPARSHNWALEIPTFSDLDGPAYLDVWSQVRDTGSMGPDAMLRAEVYECAPGLTSCVLFAEAAAYDENWSAGWDSRVINLGHITRSLTPGNLVKLRLESTHADLLIAASGNRPSRLVGTTTNPAPGVSDIDLTGPASILEGSSVDVDLAAATTDIDIEPGLSVVTNGPNDGVIVNNGDGTVTYTPDPGFSGDDQFDFELTDSIGQTGTATVFVHVVDSNGQPYLTLPEGPFPVWPDEASGEVRPNGNWRIVFDVEPGYESGYQVGQWFAQGPIIISTGGMTAGEGEWGEDLSLVIDSWNDPNGVIDWLGGFIVKPGDWYGFYYAEDYTHFIDFATTNNEGTATIKLRLDDGNATNNLSDELIILKIKNYD
ncbi:MAG: Ig-like domain-containing protein, partial [Acidimicrobiales bacterium]